jgi:hypothetical protein
MFRLFFQINMAIVEVRQGKDIVFAILLVVAAIATVILGAYLTIYLGNKVRPLHSH